MFKIYRNFYIHYSVLLIFLCFFLGENNNSPGLVLISVILHELGHLLGLLLCGCKPDKIVFHAFGVAINTGKLTFEKMLLTAISGPASSFLLAGLFYFMFPPLFPVNLCIGAVNVIPVLPLDGGRVVHTVLTKAIGRKSAGIISKLAGIFVGLVAMPLGIYLFFRSGFNVSLLLMAAFVLAEAFNKIPASPPVYFSNLKAMLGEIYIIPQSMTLRDAAELLPSDSIGAIVDEQGEILRLVTAKGLYNQLAQSHKNY